MRRRKVLASIILALTILAFITPNVHAVTGTIQGAVLDSTTGKGISGASVALSFPGIMIRPFKTTTTGETGMFSMSVDLLPGATYQLTASKTGYASNTAVFTVPPIFKILIVPPQMIHLTLLNVAPVAQAGGPYEGKIGDVISFSSAGSSDSDGSIASYSWNFDDGDTSSDPNPIHVYDTQGIYTVSLTVTDNEGKTKTDTATCTIESTEAPTAEANGPYTMEVDQTVTFNSTGSEDPDGTITEYRWDFGDGSPVSLDENPTHTYTVAGNFTVSLRVTDDDGLEHTDTAAIVVTPKPIDPVAEANGPYSGVQDQEILFSSEGSNDPDGSIVQYEWDFGDESPSVYDWNATHIYTASGTYTVTLTVTDNSGATDSDIATTSVALPPNTNPGANANGPYEGKVNEPVQLSSEGSEDVDGSITAYEWDFGDGTPVSNEANPTHTYESAGTYTVSLKVTDNRGGTERATSIVVVEGGLPIGLIIGAVVVIGGAAAAYYFLVIKKKEEKVPVAASLRVKGDPSEIPADGRSKIAVTVELLDEEGNTIEALSDHNVTLSTSLGEVTKQTTIPEGSYAAKATFTSGFDTGEAIVVAKSEGLKEGQARFKVAEKRRYCMHCGGQMSTTDRTCPKCGKAPPSGVDVKQCKNCNEVIPIVAMYCSECGASQPDVSKEEKTDEEKPEES